MSHLYNKVDADVAKLKFPNKLCNYVYTKSDGKTLQRGFIYNTDEPTYEKIRKIFQGNDSVELKEGDKVFMLPGHPLTQDRVKEYLKRENATLVTDITQATVIAGCKDFAETVNGYGTIQAKMTSPMFRCEHQIFMVKKTNQELNKTFELLPDGAEIETQWHDGTPCVVSSAGYGCLNYNANVISQSNKYFITPWLMEVIYYLLAKKLPVLTEDTITSSAHSQSKLADDDVFQNILNMISSSDEANQKLGIEILAHADLSGEIIYKTWKLRNVANKIMAVKTKAVKHFVETSNFEEVRCLNELQLLHYLEKAGELNNDIAKEILPVIFSDALGTVQRMVPDAYFGVTSKGGTQITVTMKPKWQEMLKPAEVDGSTVSF